MDVLTALYELKDKSDSLSDDHRAFVLDAIAVHESAKRQLNKQEILRIVDLSERMRGVIGACAHQLQVPVFTEGGEQTEEYECSLCHHRLKFPRAGPTLANFKPHRAR